MEDWEALVSSRELLCETSSCLERHEEVAEYVLRGVGGRIADFFVVVIEGVVEGEEGGEMGGGGP